MSETLPQSPTTPLLTVGVITFNRCDVLRRALTSALNQECDFDCEILVVDDGSTDDTPALLASISDSRLRVFRHQRNLGRPASRNTALKHMKGQFLLWLDDDDALTADALSSYGDFIQHHPAVDVAFGNLYIFDRNLEIFREDRSNSVDTDRIVYDLLFGNVVPNVGTLIRRELLNRVGSFDLHLSRGQDYDYWVRCALASAKFAHHDRFVCYYYFNEDEYSYDEVNLYVIKKNLLNAPLGECFPMYDWDGSPNKSGTFAAAAMAIVLYKYNDLKGATEFLSQASELYPSALLDSLKKLFHLKISSGYIRLSSLSPSARRLLPLLVMSRESLRRRLSEGLENI